MANPKHLFQLAVKAAKAWSDDYAQSMGAAISYYTVFSLAPLLVIVIAVAGAVFGRDAVSGALVKELGGLIGQQGAGLIQTVIASATTSGAGTAAGIISVVVLIVGATSVFSELQSALDRIWHASSSKSSNGVWSIVRKRLLSIGLIMGLVFLLMVSLVVSTAIAAFARLTSGLLPAYELLLQVINTAVSLGISTLLFAMIYKLMPSVHIDWRDVWVGGFTTAILFEIGKLLIGLYLGKNSTAHAYAAAGSVIVLLAWVYYAAQIFLFGAEFTKVYADDRTGRSAAASAAPVEQPAPATLAETPRSLARNPPRDPALESPAFKATEVGLKTALAGLFTEVAALVVVTIAGSIVHKKRQAAEKQLVSSRP